MGYLWVKCPNFASLVVSRTQWQIGWSWEKTPWTPVATCPEIRCVSGDEHPEIPAIWVWNQGYRGGPRPTWVSPQRTCAPPSATVVSHVGEVLRSSAVAGEHQPVWPHVWGSDAYLHCDGEALHRSEAFDFDVEGDLRMWRPCYRSVPFVDHVFGRSTTVLSTWLSYQLLLWNVGWADVFNGIFQIVPCKGPQMLLWKDESSTWTFAAGQQWHAMYLGPPCQKQTLTTALGAFEKG